MKNDSFLILSYESGIAVVTKDELLSILNDRSNDKTVVIDVSGEYRKLEKQVGEEIVDFKDTFINPCDITVYAKYEKSIVADFFTSFVEAVIEDECNALQKNVVERVLSDEFINKENPTLYNFYRQLLSEGSAEAKQIAVAVEPYVNGSFNSFTHCTNVNPDSRLVVIDLTSFGEECKDVALKVSLMYACSVMLGNKNSRILSIL